MIMKQIKIFIDSSVIIAGLASKTGGSHEVLALAELKLIIPCISEDVVSEVLRNVQKKLPNCVAHFFTLFKALPFRIVDANERKMDPFQLTDYIVKLHITGTCIAKRFTVSNGYTGRGEIYCRICFFINKEGDAHGIASLSAMD